MGTKLLSISLSQSWEWCCLTEVFIWSSCPSSLVEINGDLRAKTIFTPSHLLRTVLPVCFRKTGDVLSGETSHVRCKYYLKERKVAHFQKFMLEWDVWLLFRFQFAQNCELVCLSVRLSVHRSVSQSVSLLRGKQHVFYIIECLEQDWTLSSQDLWLPVSVHLISSTHPLTPPIKMCD